MSHCAFPVRVPIKLALVPGPPTRKRKNGTCCLKWHRKKKYTLPAGDQVPAAREKTRLGCQKSKSSPRLSLCLLPAHDVCVGQETWERGEDGFQGNLICDWTVWFILRVPGSNGIMLCLFRPGVLPLKRSQAVIVVWVCGRQPHAHENASLKCILAPFSANLHNKILHVIR